MYPIRIQKFYKPINNLIVHDGGARCANYTDDFAIETPMILQFTQNFRHLADVMCPVT